MTRSGKKLLRAFFVLLTEKFMKIIKNFCDFI